MIAPYNITEGKPLVATLVDGDEVTVIGQMNFILQNPLPAEPVVTP